MAQVGGYYKNARPSKVRKSAHPQPVIKFFDIERVLRSIDDEDSTNKLDPNYDESDDEEDVDLKNIGDDGVRHAPSQSAPATVMRSSFLPADGDDEDIDMASPELEEILADGPVIRKVAKGMVSLQPAAVAGGKEEEGGVFELTSWV